MTNEERAWLRLVAEELFREWAGAPVLEDVGERAAVALKLVEMASRISQRAVALIGQIVFERLWEKPEGHVELHSLASEIREFLGGTHAVPSL